MTTELFDSPSLELHFPGMEGGWKAGEFFTTEKRTMFGFLDRGLPNFLGEGEMPASSARKLVIRKLRRDAKDDDMLDQNPGMTPSEFRWLFESGLLQQNVWYAGYMVGGPFFGFRLRDVWRVHCYPGPYLDRWVEGDRLVSPKVWAPGPFLS